MNSSKPVILPSDYTVNTPAESFPIDPSTPSRGDVSWHTLISAPQTPSTDLSAGIVVCPARTGHLCRHRHTQAEIYYILQGSGNVVIDGNTCPVSKGSTVFIPGNSEHGIENTGHGLLKWFYVFPTGSFADVVYRFSEDSQKNKGKSML
jgi:mannose-6-phosphate isomerase-like protein (cupin superfamily)